MLISVYVVLMTFRFRAVKTTSETSLYVINNRNCLVILYICRIVPLYYSYLVERLYLLAAMYCLDFFYPYDVSIDAINLT